MLFLCVVNVGTRPERLHGFDDCCWSLMEDCWASEPNERPLLGYVHSRLEAIFLSHCHSKSADTGKYGGSVLNLSNLLRKNRLMDEN